MSQQLHTPEQIAAFVGDGESRLIAAAFRDPARRSELFVLPDGKARELRDFAKANLRCLFPDCAAPDLTTVSRAFKRDGFSHLPGTRKHSRESENHEQGKAVLAQWLRTLLGRDSVQVESASDAARSRVADVMATLPDGSRVAFEIQYSGLSVDAWRMRHESYMDQGITDVWLWGHTRIRKPRGEWYGTGPHCRLDDVQTEARTKGLPVLFLNPELEQIALAVPWFEISIETALKREVALQVEHLRTFTLDPDGLHSPSTRALAALMERLTQQAEVRKPVVKPVSIVGVIPRSTRASNSNNEARRQLRARQLRTPKSEVVTTGQDPKFCRNCGLKLDSSLHRTGYHVGPCEWQADGAPTARG